MKPKNVMLFAHYTRARIGRLADISCVIMAINGKNMENKVFLYIFNTFTIVLKSVTIFIQMSIVNYGYSKLLCAILCDLYAKIKIINKKNGIANAHLFNMPQVSLYLI